MNDTLIINQNISITQQYTREKDDIIKWGLYAYNNKQDKTISLDTIHAYIPFGRERDLTLIKPKAIDGFIENNCLYVFIYQEFRLDLMEYDIQEKQIEKKQIATITILLGGSVDTFGGYDFSVQKYRIENKLYFYITSRRDVGAGMSQKLIRFNTHSKRVFQFNFPEPIKKIKDEEKTFDILDLDKNKEVVSNAIKKALLNGKAVKETDKVDYIGYIHDHISYGSSKSNYGRRLGAIMFLYKINKNETKIIWYNSYKYEWQIRDYTEEEIKQP
ncbi:MAG TPA: hypothetical protein VF677_13595, partial [Flavobacterium sp.]|jgi:hypothetical protein